MSLEATEVLPYRTDPDLLARWVEARARGRASAQLRELDLAAKTLEGTLAAAFALGLVDRDTQELTASAQHYALASDAERRGLLRGLLRAYPPYARLLDAVARRSPRGVTDAAWIETWWATHGYGSSQSNRVEGTAVFGRLVEFVGWGRYIPGRRGHPTRIEWAEDAFLDAVPAPSIPSAAPSESATADAAPIAEVAARRGSEAVCGEVPSTEAAGQYNRIEVPLRSGDVARLEVPQRLSREEKRRLVELLDLLITVQDPRD